MTYTGYIYEQLQAMAETDQAIARLLSVTDILVDMQIKSNILIIKT